MSRLYPDLVESSILVINRIRPSLVPIAILVSSLDKEIEVGK
jgi:hypothetical protein